MTATIHYLPQSGESGAASGVTGSGRPAPDLVVHPDQAGAAAGLLESCADFLRVASPAARAELTWALRFDPDCSGDPEEFLERLAFTARYLRTRVDVHRRQQRPRTGDPDDE